MMRFLHWFNLSGVLALAALCAVQWRTNRALNLQVESLERTRLEQIDQLAARDTAVKGLGADLDDFRKRLTLSESQLKELDEKLGGMIRERNQLAAEREQLAGQRDQLKTTLDKWIAAVAVRDAALKQAGEQAQKLASERNDAILKFNDLAEKYNALVKVISKDRSANPATRSTETP